MLPNAFRASRRIGRSTEQTPLGVIPAGLVELVVAETVKLVCRLR